MNNATHAHQGTKMSHRALISGLLLLAAGALISSCAEPGDRINRVQANLVDKSLFEGEWWMTKTVIEVGAAREPGAGTTEPVAIPMLPADWDQRAVAKIYDTVEQVRVKSSFLASNSRRSSSPSVAAAPSTRLRSQGQWNITGESASSVCCSPSRRWLKIL